MSVQFPAVDPEGLLEYSVVFTDRALNHMSAYFQQVMRDIHGTLSQVYGADDVVIVPGGGSYGMEAVARQFATRQTCLVIRNGWFSYRWSQIFETGAIPAREIVLKARPVEDGPQAAWAPAPLEEVIDTIHRERPALVFAPHVETASGIILPDHWLAAVADAVHQHGGLLVLDCVASGAVWVDMRALGVDVLISAPQKGWSSAPGAALIMLSDRAVARLAETTSSSFACDLKKWHQIMQAYIKGGHAYHATMPTDILARFRDSMFETRDAGFELLRERQWELGRRVREMLAGHGFVSVAAKEFAAPGVVVSYTDDELIHNGRKFVEQGLQAAAGVPLMCEEPASFRTFRVGLFGLDKWQDVDRAVANLQRAVEAILGSR